MITTIDVINRFIFHSLVQELQNLPHPSLCTSSRFSQEGRRGGLRRDAVKSIQFDVSIIDFYVMRMIKPGTGVVIEFI